MPDNLKAACGSASTVSNNSAATVSAPNLFALGPEVMVVDGDGRITAINAAFRDACSLVGVSAGVGDGYEEVWKGRAGGLVPSDSAAIREGIRQVLRQELPSFTGAFSGGVGHPGTTIWVQVSASGIPGQGAMVVVCQSAGPVRTEGVVPAVSEAFVGAQMGAWMWNLSTDVITYLEGAGPISGRAPDRRPATGEAWFAQIDPSDRERISQEFQRAILHRLPYQVEFRISESGGGIRWVAVRGHCFGNGTGPATALTGMDEDITDRKEAESRFRERAVFARLGGAVANSLTRAGDLPGGLRQSLAAIVEGLEVAWAGVWLQGGGDGGRLELSASAGDPTKCDGPLLWSPIPAGSNVLTGIVRERRAEHRHSVAHDLQLCDAVWALREGITEFAAYPLLVGEECIGVVVLFLRRQLTESEVRELEELGATLAWFTQRRLEVETERRHQEEWRRSGVVNSEVDAIVATDAQGRVLHFNPAAERMFGWTSAEMVGQSAHRLIPERFRNGEVESGGWGSRGLRSNGEEFPLEVAVSQLEVNGQKLSTVILHDVSERQRAETRLRQLNRSYAVLNAFKQTVLSRPDTQAMFDAACRIAVEQGGFRLAWVGLKLPEFNRLEEAAQVGDQRHYIDGLDLRLDDEAPYPGPVSTAVRTRERVICNDLEHDPIMSPWRVDSLRLGYRSCAAFPLQAEGKIIGAFNLYAGEVGYFDDHEVQLLEGLASDIAFVVTLNGRELQRRRLEDELQRKSTFLRAQVESSADGVVVVDPQGNTVLQNRKVLELLRLAPSGGAGAEPPIRLKELGSHFKNPQQYQELMAFAAAHPGEVCRDELELNDGTQLLRVASPVQHASGRHYGRIWTFRDLTERRKLEQQLRHSQRMEVIGTLTGGIAHDFNNILAAIVGYAELAKMRTKDNPAILEYLTAVLQGGARAVDLVKNVQTFSQAPDQQRKPLQLRQAISEPLKLLRASIPTSIEFAIRLSPDLPTVWTELSHIHRVTMDLCTQAWHDMKDVSGRLGVGLDNHVVDAKGGAISPGLPPGRYVRLTITHTGRKNDRSPKEWVYRPYPPAPGSPDATWVDGVKLLEVQAIMLAHGGSFHYATLGELGAAYQVCFPAEASDLAETPATSEAAPGGHGERILYVDDEKPLALLGKKMLEDLGYVVECTTNVIEALANVRRQPNSFKLVVTDLTMPGMTGTDFARHLQEIRPNLPIILTTGYTASLTKERAREMGICELLHKPHTVHSLSAAVHRALGKRPTP